MARAAREVLRVVLLAGMSGLAWTQAAPAPAATPEPAPGPMTTQMFYLTNVSQMTEGLDITTALRNIVHPSAKIYFVAGQNALIVSTTPDQLQLVQKILSDLDRPKKTYRLTYTLTETDEGRRIGTQRFAMAVVSGQRTTMKQGSRVPVVTGTYSPGTSSAQSQFTYLDVGLNFDATLDESASGVRLRTKAEQSSIAPEVSGVVAQDPVVRQTVLEGTALLTPGKPLVLGSLDVPGSTRHIEVEVVMEVVK